MEEWEEFGEALEASVVHHEDGLIEIDNEALEEAEDEADDIVETYEELEDSHWAEEYDEAFEAAFGEENEEF